MSEYALELKGLTHRYGKHVALDNMSFQLEPGRIYGLLGRNGAGKTTLLNILSAAIFPTSGEALIFGERAHEHLAALKRLCFVREKGMYPPSIRVSEVLKSCEALYPNWDKEYVQRLVQRFGLNSKKRYKQLSRGMESSLGLIIGLASRAPLTIFDEPSLGLDAAAREHFYDELLHDLEQFPRTVIISTHLIDEVARIFEEVVIVDKGRLVVHEPTEELLGRAHQITGPAEKAEQAAKNLKVLHRDSLAGVAVISAVGEDIEEVPGVTVEPLPLQKLFVYMTEEEEK